MRMLKFVSFIVALLITSNLYASAAKVIDLIGGGGNSARNFMAKRSGFVHESNKLKIARNIKLAIADITG